MIEFFADIPPHVALVFGYALGVANAVLIPLAHRVDRAPVAPPRREPADVIRLADHRPGRPPTPPEIGRGA